MATPKHLIGEYNQRTEIQALEERLTRIKETSKKEPFNRQILIDAEVSDNSNEITLLLEEVQYYEGDYETMKAYRDALIYAQGF